MHTLADRKSLAYQARVAFRLAGYNRQGGKANRRQQIKRAGFICDWVQRHCQIHHLGQLGSHQIVKFWKAHTELADSTKYGYWLAICALWRYSGKAGEPARPRYSSDRAGGTENFDKHEL